MDLFAAVWLHTGKFFFYCIVLAFEIFMYLKKPVAFKIWRKKILYLPHDTEVWSIFFNDTEKVQLGLKVTCHHPQASVITFSLMQLLKL